MQHASDEDPRNPQVSHKEHVSSKDHYEAKTVLKARSKQKQGMDHQATTKQKYSLKDIRNRHASETSKAQLSTQSREKKSLNSLAYFSYLKQRFPQIAVRSTNCVFSTAQKSKIKFNRSLFSLQQINFHFKQVFYEGYICFYNHSIKILSQRIQELIQTIIDQNNTERYDVQIEILSFCLGQMELFEVCLDDRYKKYISFAKLQQLLRLPAKTVNKFYKCHKDNIKLLRYVHFGSQFQELFHAYYLLTVKRDIFNTSKTFTKEIQPHIQKITIQMRQKVQKSLQFFQFQDQQQKILLSELYDTFVKRQSKKIKRAKSKEIIHVLSQFEQIIDKQLQSKQKQRRIQNICNRYKKYHYKIIFKRYQRKIKSYEQLYGKDLSELKKIVIGKLLNNNSCYNYEQIVMKAFNSSLVFIDRPFYEENIVEILKREIQYHQLVYINRVIEGIEMRKSQGAQIIFADFYNVAGQDQAMKDESKEYSIIVAVGLSGSLLCRMYPGKMQSQMFLQEITNMFQEIDRQSVFIYYDRKFPHSKWLKEEKIKLSEKNCIFVNLPFIEAVPNPSQKLCQYIWQLIKEKMNQDSSNWCSPAICLQQALQFCQGTHIIEEILNKQWEKTKSLILKESESAIMHGQKAIIQKEESLQEHFDEESSQNVQRKLFESGNNIDHLAGQISNEGSQMSDPVDSSAGQSNQSEIVLNKIRCLSFQNPLCQGQEHMNNSTGLKEKIIGSRDDIESHISDSPEYPNKTENLRQFQENHAIFLSNQRNQQIPIMENLDSMNQEQLRRLLPIMKCLHSSFFLQRQSQRVFILKTLKKL